jgi:hypothetical protein
MATKKKSKQAAQITLQLALPLTTSLWNRDIVKKIHHWRRSSGKDSKTKHGAKHRELHGLFSEPTKEEVGKKRRCSADQLAANSCHTSVEVPAGNGRHRSSRK